MSDDVHRPDGRRVEASIHIEAPREAVWQAWTTPEGLSSWFTDDARGEVVEGGTITWIFREFGHEMTYPVVRVEEGRRMVLGGDIPGRGPFALEVTLEEEEGGTTVRLVNSGFLDGAEWDDEFQGVESGWRLALALLKHWLETYPDRTKLTAQAFRPVAVGPPALQPHFRDPALLESWLTRGGEGGIGQTGDAVKLELEDGSPLTGRVLARSDSEVAVSWEERQAALELKVFSGPDGWMAGLRLTGWGMGEEELAELRPFLDRAADDLARTADTEPAGDPAA